MDQVQAVEPSRGKVATLVVGARDFVVEVRAEMIKVTWPTKDELIDATKRVVIMTLAIGTLIGVLDVVLKKILVDGVAALTR